MWLSSVRAVVRARLLVGVQARGASLVAPGVTVHPRRASAAPTREHAAPLPTGGNTTSLRRGKDGDAVERVGHRIAAAGMASRRGAEGLIAAGAVAVNGVAVTHPATFVKPEDEVTVNGVVVPHRRPPRVFLVHKLAREIVSRADPAGRPTLFARLAQMGLPDNLITVGRLDFMSEGLLVATTSGPLARHLELPSSRYQRVYRVKVYGRHVARAMAALRKGVVINGVRYAATAVDVESARHKGATATGDAHESRGGSTEAGDGEAGDEDVGGAGNDDANPATHSAGATPRAGGEGHAARPPARIRDGDTPSIVWCRITLAEGKNREIRRVVEHFGCVVNRLIRVRYGPFQLGRLSPGSAMEVAIPRGLMAAAMGRSRPGRGKPTHRGSHGDDASGGTEGELHGMPPRG